MYLPDLFKTFSEKYPEISQQHEKLATACRESGPMDPKTQHLVKLGIAIGTGSRGGVMSQTRKALGEGATPEELSQAALLALTTIGFSQMMAALSWIWEVLEKAE
ncbi:MAG: carboxymuconolactone decarboxylase family protein [Desulfatibacillum sp.]|nr:carboxymuconolactone decarboxylase family protein [Desulfatibacillum sp.]